MEDGVRNVKAYLELNLMMSSKDNKKGFYRCITSQRKSRGRLVLLLNGTWDLVTNNTEKPEELNALFASVFTGNTCLQNSQVLETFGKVWSKETFSSTEEHYLRKHLH